MEDLKPVALAPGPDGTPNFSFPNVFDLSDSEGYYQTVVVPRQQRQMSRMLHNKQLHDQNLKAKKAAGPVKPICWDAATHMGCQKGSKYMPSCT